MLRAGYSRTASDPSVVANAIARAVQRSRPILGTPWAAGPAPCSWSTAY